MQEQEEEEGRDMKKERQNPWKLAVIACVLAALVIGFYFYLRSNKYIILFINGQI